MGYGRLEMTGEGPGTRDERRGEALSFGQETVETAFRLVTKALLFSS